MSSEEAPSIHLELGQAIEWLMASPLVARETINGMPVAFCHGTAPGLGEKGDWQVRIIAQSNDPENQVLCTVILARPDSYFTFKYDTKNPESLRDLEDIEEVCTVLQTTNINEELSDAYKSHMSHYNFR